MKKTEGRKGRKGRRGPEIRVTSLVRSPISVASAARLAAHVVRREKAKVAAMSITFVGPTRMKALNLKHLARHRETDVIAFSLGPPVSRDIVGDVYVCPSVAAENAKRFGTTAIEELRRLVVHGVLHAIGYEHPDGEARTKSAMWKVQERYLA